MTRRDAASGVWAAAPPPRQPVLFVNPRSGGGTAARVGLVERARQRGITVVVLREGEDLRALVGEAVATSADALGMAGGDGSLAVVAAAAAAASLPFVPVPAGTRNHFARDIGLDPLDVVGALDAFGDGVERRVDMADVDGRSFLNNVSLGLYGEAVQRPEYRSAKARTVLETAREVAGQSGRAPALRLADGAGREYRDPVVVLVSNNPYALRPAFRRGARPALDGGRLGIAVLHRLGSSGLLAAATWTATSLRIDGDQPLHAGIDGEAVQLRPPLLFRIRPRTLRVRAACANDGGA